ncbi:diadenylate cyclase CdaA [Streptococcus orisratti]|uniref:diadenylate cyclase CdaA n=1 Tax=Streptococcus orisratti TaxID=114652 RepID=UPI002357D44C|nr:diadenylate cyclase CdaA [Streptococcus orisratti]MCI7677446.1 diadenylate cyclase CdaA [Streptococcus orisratti]MDY4001625.1 diadenylate cyclase CdaA [Streptococcus orisratti]MDY5635361.1 diadenylate cyclase CdaA [Streptococcus orisratti]
MRNLMAIDANFWASLVENPWMIVVHILDILIVAYLIYRLIKALAGTKIMSLIQGVILFILLRFVAELIGFTTITYLMNQVITYGVIAGVVIFAPEIRTGLEKFGRTTQVFLQTQHMSDEEKLVQALVNSVAYMSPRKIGALIAIEQTQTLQEYISTGIKLDADVSSQLLINIFIPNTPLHDGAVIIQGNKIATACSYLPLSESKAISKEFGTRHRAAIGLSENSDALTIVVSEETGAISITYKGEFIHDLSKENLKVFLSRHFASEKVSKTSWYHRFLGRREK